MAAILRGSVNDLELLTLSDVSEAQLDVEESGLTLEENAYIKARAFFDATGIACVADDTGLEIEALSGAPGIHTARFAGEEASYEDNVRLVLQQMESVPEERRGAQFRCVICYCDALRTVFAEGICKGRIATGARGEAGFGYDPVFIPDGSDHTFAELEAGEKNRISHRALALKQCALKLAELMAD
jgi:XTP/dITP diphosphohydrolase